MLCGVYLCSFLNICSKYWSFAQQLVQKKRRKEFIIGHIVFEVRLAMSKEVEFCNRDRFIELGLMIASLRKRQGMSQEKLAEKAKISRSHLSSIEAPNIVRPFSLEVLYNIADALGVRAGDLLNSTFPTGTKV